MQRSCKAEKIELNGRHSEVFVSTMKTSDGMWMLWHNKFSDEGHLFMGDFKFRLRGLEIEEPASDNKSRLLLEIPGG